MNFQPLGPIIPKKPKAKKLQIEVDGELVFGWIDAESQPTQGVEIFAVNEKEEYCIPLDGIYILLEYSYSIQVLNGIIQ